MSKIRDALEALIVEFDERSSSEGGTLARGTMRFAAALEGPPARLHGGHHAHVRTLPILERLSAHDASRTFPCSLDVSVRRALPLGEDVPFEARYLATDEGFELTTRFDGSERLLATVRSRADEPLVGAAELARLKALYDASRPSEKSFRMFGVTVHLAPELVFVETFDPAHAEPASQIAAMSGPSGAFGPALMATQLDSVGAIAQGTRMRHPHFTKRIELSYATGVVTPEDRAIFLADRTTIEGDPSSETPEVEIEGERWGTACIRVALVDERFERALAVGRVTVHPVDPEKFEPLQKMRQLRGDLPG